MKFSRRNLLRSTTGLALSLPWLEAFAQTSAPPPRRLVTVFTANGDQIDQRFTTKGETNWVFNDMLTPFEPYRQNLLVLDMVNKYHDQLPAGHVADGHEQGGSALAPWQSGSGSFPIGGSCDSSGNNCEYIGYVEGPSIDRAIGDRIVADFGLPQRHLTFRVGDNYNDIWNTHSHAGPPGMQNPVPPETSPFTAYTRIFANVDTQGQQDLARRLAMKQSALDLMTGELTKMQSRVGAADKQRLDQHATALRDIERQLSMTSGVHPSCNGLTLGSTFDVYNADNHLQVGKLFFKIIAMSLACDLVRTVAFNWSGNTSDRVYSNLGLTEGHHTISHMSDATSFGKIRSIKKYLFQQSCLLHDELKALPEAGGTLFDRTMVMHWSELSQGDTHQKDSDLVILASNDNYFRMGRMLDLTNKPKRALSNLLISLWNYMGYTDVTTWGDPLLLPDGDGPMPNLV